MSRGCHRAADNSAVAFYILYYFASVLANSSISGKILEFSSSIRAIALISFSKAIGTLIALVLPDFHPGLNCADLGGTAFLFAIIF